MKSPTPHLRLALDSFRAVVEYAPSSREELFGSRLIQDAILMRFQVAGEELSKIRSSYPDFWAKQHTEDWNALIGMRNIISHQYVGIDYLEHLTK